MNFILMLQPIINIGLFIAMWVQLIRTGFPDNPGLFLWLWVGHTFLWVISTTQLPEKYLPDWLKDGNGELHPSLTSQIIDKFRK